VIPKKEITGRAFSSFPQVFSGNPVGRWAGFRPKACRNDETGSASGKCFHRNHLKGYCTLSSGKIRNQMDEIKGQNA
jgi:hypothetical protein